MPKAWNELTARGQARRVRSLLPLLASRYGWDCWGAHKLSHGENTTFELRTGVHRERFVVRVHRPGYHDRAEILSELAWLKALRRDLQLAVPEPVADLQERILHRITTERLTEPRHVVVFHWVDGELMGINWLKSRSDNPRLRGLWQKHVAATIQKGRNYLTTHG